jgi:glycosyltransferase involved in cell wall biosynthesis
MSDTNPRVSFVVPCYKLGHLLGECIVSILSQSYDDLEVIVMDDCSPDETPAIARSFRDPRVRYVRNERNLGHMENYNKGVELARGEYVWLISADDRLRRPYVLERFVYALDVNPSAGYVFCPVVRFRDSEDLHLYGVHGDTDALFDGRRFFLQLADGNSVPAASTMARRRCYQRQGKYPLDLPFANDWYMWALFAFAYDVVYLAEPMVGWRVHDANMTLGFKQRPTALVADELTVRWRLLRLCETRREPKLAAKVFRLIAADYSLRVVRYAATAWPFGLTEPEFEASLAQHAWRPGEQAALRALVYAALGDHYFQAPDVPRARELYERSLHYAPRSLRTLAKLTLLKAGQLGVLTRSAMVGLRQAIR